MPLTEAELCSAALVKLGARPVASLDEPTVEAELAARLYPVVRDATLLAHPWAFSLAQAELERDPVPPAGDFAASFRLPPDLLRTLSAGCGESGRGLVYRVFGNRLHADATRVLLTYQRRPAAAEFPPHFVAALVARLAAELCLPLTENAARAEVLHRLAASELKLAKSVDSQQATPRAIEDFTLVEARLG
ncbi:MAG: hypothetical protein N2038_10370 [Geminicoccaceae bacterium]|nr:hypothetical protein [Geminicoccaceae bacterium]MCS7267593.1 hypothetical protein [Geminicoccaceae bacterium]MCX7630643.1 hypothetical protein [Geminicoccaceae bacterium]MDW8123151.1 hypothetical protein [Geminicoccaceae bacterium]MDW8340189.1 hypothetical protein [Geminicoccaceae bacterium]